MRYMRPLLWLSELHISLTVQWHSRRAFRRDGHLTPQARRCLAPHQQQDAA
jgi:hypothetical protein